MGHKARVAMKRNTSSVLLGKSEKNVPLEDLVADGKVLSAIK
jgi:hypothetical protein